MSRRSPRANVSGRLLLGAAVAVGGCGARDVREDTRVASSAKIIGENDLVPVVGDGANIPARYAPLLDAIGAMSNDCTVTHIGEGLALSAGHCFRDLLGVAGPVGCAAYSVSWGLRADEAPYLKSACRTLLAAELSRDRDYAVFTVDPAPPARARVATGRPAVGRTITIFSHPSGRPLEWSNLCTVQAPSPAAGVGIFTYLCDTESGSSGAAIIDDETLSVVGVHGGGSTQWNYGTFLSDTPLDEILAGLANPPARPPGW